MNFGQKLKTMKNLKIALVLIALIVSIHSYSQFEQPENLSVGYIFDGVPCDVDGDEDMDIILYSSQAGKIYWRENTNGNFDTQHDILTGSSFVISIKYGDLDSDGDNDFATLYSNGLSFFQNTDGAGNYSEGTFLSDEVDFAKELYIEDIDADGDQDIILRYAADDYINTISWFENIDNSLEFEPEQTIVEPSTSATTLCFIDLDGDLNKDMVLGFSDRIVWLSNLNNGNFSSENSVTTSVNEVISLDAADMDGDGDNDIVAASFNDNKLSWYKNSGTGSFGSQQLLTNNYLGGYRLKPIDIDNDADIDLVGISAVVDYYNTMFYYENTGSGNFNSPQNLSENAPINEVFIGDIDNDNDNDIITLHQTDMVGMGSFYLCENLLYSVNLNNCETENVMTYPNPVIDRLNIILNDNYSGCYSIELYELSGKLVYVNDGIRLTNSSINLEELSNGLYIGKLKLTKDNSIIKEFKILVQK